MAMNLNPRKNGGPVVKTGPTAGSVRSRKASTGTWRKKRSDAGKTRK